MIIGGYFELELPKGEEYYKGALRLNSGRNAFEYILLAKSYQKVYLPNFFCDVMLEPIQKLALKYEFYKIDKSFRPIFDFRKIQPLEVFVYINYFGICDSQSSDVAEKCNSLIIDNSQAFYSNPLPNVNTFYSPRKFFGITDGAYLFTDTINNTVLEQDISFKRFEHLTGRIDIGAEACYSSFKNNNANLANQPIKTMSNLTQRILKSVNYVDISNIRRKNFNYLHSVLKDSNQLKFDINPETVPMVYPYLVDDGFLLKRKLINMKIFVATYWPNVIKFTSVDTWEGLLANNTVFLPIDQRYGINEMIKIIKVIFCESDN